MPNFAIVDSHVHLYDIGRFRYGWLDSAPKLKRTSLLEDFDRARGRVEVDKIVFAEVAFNYDETSSPSSILPCLANLRHRPEGGRANALKKEG